MAQQPLQERSCDFCGFATDERTCPKCGHLTDEIEAMHAPRSDRPHLVSATYVLAHIKCGRCGKWWEQPHYEPNLHFVCPHCNHGAIPEDMA